MTKMRILVGLVLAFASFLCGAHAQKTTQASSTKTKNLLEALDGLFPLGNPATWTSANILWTPSSGTTITTTDASTTSAPSSVSHSNSITSEDPSDTASSSRSAASGFWTGSDPFSFVWPSSLTSSLDKNDMSTSTDKSSASSSTVKGSSVTTKASGAVTGATPDLSTSISTQVTWVTASPVSPPVSSNSDSQLPDQSSSGEKNALRNGIWLLLALALLVYQHW